MISFERKLEIKNFVHNLNLGAVLNNTEYCLIYKES